MSFVRCMIWVFLLGKFIRILNKLMGMIESFSNNCFCSSSAKFVLLCHVSLCRLYTLTLNRTRRTLFKRKFLFWRPLQLLFSEVPESYFKKAFNESNQLEEFIYTKGQTFINLDLFNQHQGHKNLLLRSAGVMLFSGCIMLQLMSSAYCIP